MIFFFTSMYYEAAPIIKMLNLKKDISFSKFQVFKNKDYILLITGNGSINSAIGATYLLSNYKINDNDLFINIGVCGVANQKHKIGDIFICNKITENETKKHFYPDILYNHPFKEEEIETFSYIVKNESNMITEKLIDMETSGLYQAGRIFLKQNQLFFIKIVSDYLGSDNRSIKPKDIEYLINININNILNWILEIYNNLYINNISFNDNDSNILNNISEKLKLSVSMKNQLKQLLIYYKAKNNDFTKLIDEFFLENGNMDCTSKMERRKYFDKLKEKII